MHIHSRLIFRWHRTGNLLIYFLQCLMIALIFAVWERPAVSAVLYSVTSLYFTPYAINNNGQMLGGSYLWQNGNITNLGSFYANAINDNG